KDKNNKSESVRENNVPQSYDLKHPQKKWALADELKEISGQAWIDEKHLLAIEDLHPTLYLLRLDSTATIEKTSTFKDSSDKKFEKFTNEKLLFFPSAIAVHPITHDIYILSTKDNKCMAQYSYNGELKSLQFFDKDLLPQPEGICFAPDGTMYISTEGRHGEQA